MKTKAEIRMQWRCAGQSTYDLVIPKGTRVVPTGDGEFFVDDLSWIENPKHSFLHHDATYYGIRLQASQVEGS